MEMIALQAVKCTAVLRTLCGHRATRLLNPLVQERDGEGEVSTCTHLACKYNSQLSLELRVQSSSIWFLFFLLIVALCQSAPIQ